MAIIGTMYWANKNPLSDKGFVRLPDLFEALRKNGNPPAGWVGGSVFHNDDLSLPDKPDGYDCGPPGSEGRDAYRCVLGRSGEVYVTSSHYTGNWQRLYQAPIL